MPIVLVPEENEPTRVRAQDCSDCFVERDGSTTVQQNTTGIRVCIASHAYFLQLWTI
eukprot:m.1685893 g.1685893  ORF g.1685893 m.1685893 type:complete len:57 (+) comp258718_c0_seq1:47-217(+)